MKLSSIAVPAALALLARAEKFTPFDKSKLAADSFFEQFDSDDWAQLWRVSKALRDEEFTYSGEWSVEEPVIFPGLENDKGLVLKTPAAHHAIHAKLPTPFVNTDNTLVLQYEVKLQNSLSCGGAYIKLLSSEGLPDDDNEFDNDTSYQIMFGPDKCGATNKVHFILRRKDPNTGIYEEKHLAVPPLARVVTVSTLYTLIIEPNQDYQIRINGEVVKAGNLLEDGATIPGLNPPKQIEDPNDTKPEDWDDEQYILDPNQTEKPEDWDEDAPYLIEDPNDVKPESWNEETPEYIEDPEAEKPEDWDDEEDGEFIAPLILNPECEEHGCGKWEPSKIPNPDYKGKWEQPTIENPNYKGEWAPKLIDNPNYYEDTRPSDLESIGGIGFELWSMQNDILFDNIYLGHSIEEAELIGNETFVPKLAIENAAVLENTPKPKASEVEEPIKSQEDEEESDFLEDIINQIHSIIGDGKSYLAEFLNDPLNTLSSKPVEGGLYAALLVVIGSTILVTLSSLINLITGSPSPTPTPAPASRREKKVVEVEEEGDEEIVEKKTTSGAETSETIVSKRS